MKTGSDGGRGYMGRVTNGVKSTLLLVLLIGTLAVKVWKKN